MKKLLIIVSVFFVINGYSQVSKLKCFESYELYSEKSANTKIDYFDLYSSPSGNYVVLINGYYFDKPKGYRISLWSNLTNSIVATFGDTYMDPLKVINQIKFSPDEDYFVACSDDKIFCKYSTNGTFLGCVENAHEKTINSIDISANGLYYATGSKDETIKIWANLKKAELVKTFKGHTASIVSVCFSPDGKYVASGSKDATVKIWDLNTGNCYKTLTGHKDKAWVRNLKFSSDGTLLLSGDNERTINIWSVSDGSLLKSLKISDKYSIKSARIDDLGFLFDVNNLIYARLGTEYELFDMSSGKSIFSTIKLLPKYYIKKGETWGENYLSLALTNLKLNETNVNIEKYKKKDSDGVTREYSKITSVCLLMNIIKDTIYSSIKSYIYSQYKNEIDGAMAKADKKGEFEDDITYAKRVETLKNFYIKNYTDTLISIQKNKELNRFTKLMANSIQQVYYKISSLSTYDANAKMFKITLDNNKTYDLKIENIEDAKSFKENIDKVEVTATKFVKIGNSGYDLVNLKVTQPTTNKTYYIAVTMDITTDLPK